MAIVSTTQDQRPFIDGQWEDGCEPIEVSDLAEGGGSIPPRTDAPTDKFGPYLTKTIKEYGEVSHKPPTIAHGLAVLPDVHSDIDGVITNEFLGSENLDSATKGMLDAVSGSN